MSSAGIHISAGLKRIGDQELKFIGHILSHPSLHPQQGPILCAAPGSLPGRLADRACRAQRQRKS